MNDTNQHYITRAYLDKFVHPTSQDQVLFPYRKGGKPCRRMGTKRLGSAINFYRQKENGLLNDRLDQARGTSEALFFSGQENSLYSRLLSNPDFVPDHSERLYLAGAAAFLWCGSPVQIHNTAMYLLLLHQMELFNGLNTDEVRGNYRKEFGEEAEGRLERDRDEILKGNLVIDVGEENWKQLGFRSFDIEPTVIQLLLNMNLSIVHCRPKTDSFFVTSDNPVVKRKQDEEVPEIEEVWFPLAHDRGALWHRRKHPPRFTCGHSQERSLNRMVIRQAYKYIYSPLHADWLRFASAEICDNQLFGHYGSLEEVLKHARPAVGPNGEQGEIVDLLAAIRQRKPPSILGV